jgi:hypothetical protein
MPGAIPYYRLTVSQQIDLQIANTREVMARSLELLRTPKPDAFVGRKTQEPFSQELPQKTS